MKIHKEHLDNARANKQGEKQIAPCKVYYDANAAKELLLLASSIENQQQWISCLRKKIEQGGYAAANSAAGNQSMRHQSNLSINSNSSAGAGAGNGNGNGNGATGNNNTVISSSSSVTSTSIKSLQSQLSRNSVSSGQFASTAADLLASQSMTFQQQQPQQQQALGHGKAGMAPTTGAGDARSKSATLPQLGHGGQVSMQMQMQQQHSQSPSQQQQQYHAHHQRQSSPHHSPSASSSIAAASYQQYMASKQQQQQQQQHSPSAGGGGGLVTRGSPTCRLSDASTASSASSISSISQQQLQQQNQQQQQQQQQHSKDNGNV